MPSGFAIVLPARFHSTRFPGKPLALIAGRPLIEWVYRRAVSVPGAGRVIIATDHEKILEAARGFGAEAVMTSAGCATGTDRVAEVARNLGLDPVVNLQGDEPLFPPDLIVRMVGVISESPGTDTVTACHPIHGEEEMRNPHAVKVVMDRSGRALYFSRSGIPFRREPLGASAPARHGGEGEAASSDTGPADRVGAVEASRGPRPGPGVAEPRALGYRHIGIYVFRRASLLRFSELPPTALELSEGLEQLRALEHGMVIRVVETSQPTVGVDVPEDVKIVEKALVGA